MIYRCIRTLACLCAANLLLVNAAEADPGDPDVSVAVSPSSVSEDGGTNLVYTFTRSGVTTGALTVNFTVGGTASSSSDYAPTGADTFDSPAGQGTVTFTAGNATATVTIDPGADSTVELDETVILTVAAGTGYNVAASPNDTATGTIANDDTEVSVVVSPSSVSEDGGTNLVYTFTRTGVTTGALTVNFTVGGTASSTSDYVASGADTFDSPAGQGTVTFGAGNATATVTIDPSADSTVEPNETVILTVAAGTGYNVAASPDDTATGTIANDDTEVSVAVSPSSVSEDGGANLVYTFTRTGVTTGALTVNFTVGGTASSSSDYVATGADTFDSPAGQGTVTFGAGNATAAVTIDPSAD
ncbi:MAG: hypothetical protein QOD12_2475, partial [Verrucomicrobiota bacterium]